MVYTQFFSDTIFSLTSNIENLNFIRNNITIHFWRFSCVHFWKFSFVSCNYFYEFNTIFSIFMLPTFFEFLNRGEKKLKLSFDWATLVQTRAGLRQLEPGQARPVRPIWTPLSLSSRTGKCFKIFLRLLSLRKSQYKREAFSDLYQIQSLLWHHIWVWNNEYQLMHRHVPKFLLSLRKILHWGERSQIYRKKSVTTLTLIYYIGARRILKQCRVLIICANKKYVILSNMIIRCDEFDNTEF